jgi:hypothetical protein
MMTPAAPRRAASSTLYVQRPYQDMAPPSKMSGCDGGVGGSPASTTMMRPVTSRPLKSSQSYSGAVTP